VGCGNGVYLPELRRRGHPATVLGFDQSPGMVRTADALARTGVADAQRLPLRDAGVDLEAIPAEVDRIVAAQFAGHQTLTVTSARPSLLDGVARRPPANRLTGREPRGDGGQCPGDGLVARRGDLPGVPEVVRRQ
jgi:Methyltransferase domain